MTQDWQQALHDFVKLHPKFLAITGAGISANSGIPTYRNDRGDWQSRKPIQHQQFIDDSHQRQRYWSRSAIGWPTINTAKPSNAHRALVELEKNRTIPLLVTQNVDRLHQRAGHKNVIDLHGRIDQVVCLTCRETEARCGLQRRLIESNPHLAGITAELRPDGDADINDATISSVHCPVCLHCKGVLMPNVVFFGANVPVVRHQVAHQGLAIADALVVVGSSLMVYSGFRFCKRAHELGKPILIINRGKTRADDLATLKIDQDCDDVLAQWISWT
ncbi:MAG: NAD-dependent protein deacetylase [Oceanicoccus sp.]